MHDRSDAKDAPQTWALDTLGENETIARLATGIKRFKLPDEHNFIKLYQQVLALRAAGRRIEPAHRAQQLGTIFENRRQYRRAAEYWRRRSSASPATSGKQYQASARPDHRQLGRFEASLRSRPAAAHVDFRFRNAKKVDFIAQPIDVAKLLADVKDLSEIEAQAARLAAS